MLSRQQEEQIFLSATECVQVLHRAAAMAGYGGQRKERGAEGGAPGGTLVGIKGDFKRPLQPKSQRVAFGD